MRTSVVTFARLPAEEPAFLEYLAKTGEVWARPVEDKADCEPAPVADFLAAHAAELDRNGVVHVYLGFRPDVLAPAMSEAGCIDISGARLIAYTRGGFYPGGELAQSNLFFYRRSFLGDAFVTKPEAFIRWAGNVLGWVRRRTPEQVPVYRCNYRTRATPLVAEAAARGLKVWY